MPAVASPLRLPLTAAVCIALLLLLGGCGGNDDDDAEAGPNGDGAGEIADNAVADAAAATLAAGTAGIAYEASFVGPDGPYSFTAEGEVDYGAYRSRLAYDLSNVPDGGDNVEVLIDGPVLFFRFPEGSQDVRLPEGREWIRLEPEPPEEPEEPAEEEGPAPQLDVAGIQQDPTQFLRYLQSGATDVQGEGTEEVRGVDTTIYTALIDLDRVIEEGGPHLGEGEEEQAVAVRAAESLRAQLAGTELPVTVNVDGDGRVRRLLLSFDVMAGPGEQISALTTTDYFDFGDAVDVEPPPEERVIDAADVE